MKQPALVLSALLTSILRRLASEASVILRDFILAFFCCVFVLYFLVQPFKVEGNSMSPGLGNQEVILVEKVSHRVRGIRRGDVVVFRNPDKSRSPMVKRVVGLPGDRVAIDAGRVIVNNQVHREALPIMECKSSDSFGPAIVGSHRYFVLGDCRKASRDSRIFGAVPAKGILGKAVLSLWPPASAGRVQ